MKKLALKALVLLIVFFLVCPDQSFAIGIRQSDTSRFAAGVQRLLLAPFQIPYQLLAGTMRGPFLIGTIGGVFSGVFYTIGDLAGGAFDMAAASAPYAKYGLLAL